MKINVISFSLWGNNKFYWQGALQNIKDRNRYYPGYICRFYIDNKCDKNLISALNDEEDVEILLVDGEKSWHGMFWRFYAASDPDIDILLVRDTDCRFSDREVGAVNEWINSEYSFHIMRDHPYHTVPILGGLWGCKKNYLSNMSELIDNWKNHTSKKGDWLSVQTAGDQNFLQEVIYPKVMKNSLEHIDFNLHFGGNSRKFPSIRNEYEFVGDAFDENNERNPNYWKIIRTYIR
jgi:hypothetical protein